MADLLKESGILENSPPTSPNDTKQANSSPDFAESAVLQQQPQQTVFMVPTGANQTPHNLVLTQSGLQTPGLNQLRLALTADGNMILQPSGPNVPSFSVPQPVTMADEAAGIRKAVEMAKDPVLGASQPSPDSTTPTLDATPQSMSTNDQASGQSMDNKSCEKHEAESKAAIIPMTVADINSTNESQKAKSGREEVNRGSGSPVNSSSPAHAAIRIANCDNQSSTLPVFLSSDAVSKKTDGVVATASAGPVMQISLDDKAFMEGLEAQIKGLACMSSATEQQKSQLRELQNLQNQISEAKKNQAAIPVRT